MGWWHRLFQKAAIPDPVVQGLRFPQVPSHHEIVPEELAVRVYAHEFPGDTPVLCWSYVTDGLRRYGQQEIVLTLSRDPSEEVSHFPHDPFEFFHRIYGLAVQEKWVGVGDFTLFQLPNGFLGQQGSIGITYISAATIPRVNYPEKPIAGILLTPKESEVIPIVGPYRILSRLAEEQNSSPLPVWSPKTRPDQLSPSELPESILGKLPVIYLKKADLRWLKVAGDSDEDKTVPDAARQSKSASETFILRIPASQQASLLKWLENVPQESGFILATAHSNLSDAFSVWDYKAQEIKIIKLDTKGIVSQTGGFLAILPIEDQPSKLNLCEDGFILSMSKAEITGLRHSFERKSLFEFTTADRLVLFRVRWERELKKSKSVEVRKELSYQIDSVIENRVLNPILVREYLDLIHLTIEDFFELLPQEKGKSFHCVFALKPTAQVRYWFDFSPEPIATDSQYQLMEQLLALTPPPVQNGPVAFGISFRVWGGEAKEKQQIALPMEWQEVSATFKENDAVIPDDVLKVLWP